MGKGQTLTLSWLPVSLNEYIQKERGNRFAAAKIKGEETLAVWAQCRAQALSPVKSPVHISYHWIVKNKKKDKSNIAFAKKFIEDGLVQAGVLKNDGFDDINSFTDSFEVGTPERVIVTITEV